MASSTLTEAWAEAVSGTDQAWPEWFKGVTRVTISTIVGPRPGPRAPLEYFETPLLALDFAEATVTNLCAGLPFEQRRSEIHWQCRRLGDGKVVVTASCSGLNVNFTLSFDPATRTI